MATTNDSPPHLPTRVPIARRPGRGHTARGAMAVEAAVILPIIVTMMLGMWEVGRLAQVSRTLKDAAREGARIAAGGADINGSSVTVANVQQSVRDFLTAAGLPSAAVSGATIAVNNLSANSWTDPGSATQLDLYSVTVTIPPGAAFDSLKLIGASVCGVTQLQESIDWLSCNDLKVTVNTQLPY